MFLLKETYVQLIFFDPITVMKSLSRRKAFNLNRMRNVEVRIPILLILVNMQSTDEFVIILPRYYYCLRW